MFYEAMVHISTSGGAAGGLAELGITPLSGGGRSGQWLTIDITDAAAQDGVDGWLEIAREWSAKLGRQVAIVEDADYGFSFALFDGGELTRRLDVTYDDGWKTVVGEPLPWEAMGIEVDPWDDIEDYDEGSPEHLAWSEKRLVEGSRFPSPGSFRGWRSNAGFPSKPSHQYRRPKGDGGASSLLSVVGIALGILLGVGLLGGLLGLLFHACGAG